MPLAIPQKISTKAKTALKDIQTAMSAGLLAGQLDLSDCNLNHDQLFEIIAAFHQEKKNQRSQPTTSQ